MIDGWSIDRFDVLRRQPRERESARTPRFSIHPSSSCNTEKREENKIETAQSNGDSLRRTTPTSGEPPLDAKTAKRRKKDYESSGRAKAPPARRRFEGPTGIKIKNGEAWERIVKKRKKKKEKPTRGRGGRKPRRGGMEKTTHPWRRGRDPPLRSGDDSPHCNI